MSYRFIDKSPFIRLVIFGIVAIVFCGVEATYHGGVKTRTYMVESEPQVTTYTTHHVTRQYVPVSVGEYRYSHGSNSLQGNGHGNANDYQHTATTHETHGASAPSWSSSSSYGQSDASGSYQPQQREGEYYQHNRQPQKLQRQHHVHHSLDELHSHGNYQPQPQQTVAHGTTHSSLNFQAPGVWQGSENSITDYYTGCPSGHTGQLPYAYDCRRFLNCWKGRGHIQSCSVATVFNPETLECDRPDKVRCEAGLGQGASTGTVHSPDNGQLKQKQHPNYRAGRYTDVSTSEVDILCPPDARGLQPHPSDCTKFINCANGNVHIQDCGPGTAFDVNMQVCDFKDKVDCTGRGAAPNTAIRQGKSQVACPPGVSGLYPHPHNCSNFLQCANGQTYVQNCGPGTAFDSVRLLCDFRNKVNCSSEGTTKAGRAHEVYQSGKVICPHGVSGLYPHPYDCTKFLQCANGQTYIQDCGPGTAFDSVHLVCGLRNKVKCASNGTLGWTRSEKSYGQHGDNASGHGYGAYGQSSYSQGIACPQGVIGLHPHPYNCTKFLQCANGQTRIQNCGPGQAFDSVNLVCGLKGRVKCAVNGTMGWTMSENAYGQHEANGHAYGAYEVNGQNSQSQSIACPPGVSGLYPHTYNCTKFLQCANGQTFIQNCGPGTAFDSVHLVCGFKDKVKCASGGTLGWTKLENSYDQHGSNAGGNVYGLQGVSGQSSHSERIVCPHGASGLYPHPHDCMKFLQCDNGQTYIQDCGPGTAFDNTTKVCGFKSKAKCATNGTLAWTKSEKSHGEHGFTGANAEKVECPPGVSGLYAHPYDCEKFLQCSNGQTFIQNCGPGTGFDSVRLVCDYKGKVHCGAGTIWGSSAGRDSTEFVRELDTQQTTSTSSSSSSSSSGSRNDLPHNADILCLSGITGIFPYPFDYTKFINCKNGNTAIQNCVQGTAFSISKGYCESQEQIEKSDHVMYIVSEVSYEYSQTLITCPPGTEGMHLYPFNAEKFVKCVHSQMEIASCPHAQVFSTTRRLCLPTDQVLKYERVRLLSELQKSNAYRFTDEFFDVHTMVYCPMGLSGTYPHPFDNSKYIRCGGGRMLRESCASGKAYSLSRKECDMKENIDANDRVPQALIYGGYTDIETTFSSTDGLTYLMCPHGLSGYYLHPFDCTKYLECSNGATKVESCANGSVFSISRQECIPRDRVEAFDRVEYLVTTQHELSNEYAINSDPDLGISCSPGTFGIYPHPQDNRMYVRCANGRITVEHCAPGESFSLEKSFCHNERDVAQHDRGSYTKSHQSGQYNPGEDGQHTQIQYTAGGTAGSPVTTTTTTTSNGYNTEAFMPEHKDIACPAANSNGRYPHPYDCTKFVMCSNGEAHIQSCGPGTAWNKEMEVCDFKDKVDCSQSSGSVAPTQASGEVLCPAGVEGLYQHPHDWHKYLSCTHGRTYIMDCGPGTVFSVSRKICDLEPNVATTDRCNNGVHHTSYDYSHTQTSNGQPIAHGSNQWSYTQTQHQPASTTYTQTNRWTNMNVPRPQGSTYDQESGTWQHVSQPQPQAPHGWIATATNVDTETPAEAVIYEEGSLRPDSNYNRQFINTPLAPLAPGTAATSTSTIVYAQPVGSQEDSQETFNTPQVQPFPQTPYSPQPTHRQNFTRQIHYAPTSNIWIPIGPSTQLVPPGQTPVTPNLMPPLAGTGETPLSPLPPVPSPFTPQMSPNHPSYYPYPIPQPSAGSNIPIPPNHMLPPNYSNVDRGQRPLTDTDRTLTTIKTDNIPHQPSPFDINGLDSLPSGSRKVHVVDDTNRHDLPQIPRTFANQPTTTQRSYVDVYEHTTQIPRPSQATTPISAIPGYPQLSNATIQTFPHQPHYSHGYSGVAHSRNTTLSAGRKIPQHSAIKPLNQTPSTKLHSQTPPHTEHVKEPTLDLNDPENLPLKEALQLMLRPYLNHSEPVDDDLAAKAQSHIMSLVKTKETITTTHNPLHPTPLNSLPATTPHQDDVELILAGEQHHLVSTTSIRPGSHLTNTTYETTLELGHSTSSKLHDHNSNWHKYHHNNPSSSKVHTREFHEKHPNVPSPFEEGEGVEVNVYGIDIRSNDDCPFNCGNGRCIQRHEVCNGVNNCGNRKDEMQCDHLGYEVRLTGGESSHMGRIEVKILGRWGYVCDDKFGLKDADVLCRELGFKMGAMEVRGSSYYPPSDINTSFTMDEVECKGNETSLRECDFKGWGVNNCGPDEVVGVVCKVQKMKCPDNYWLCAKSEECIPTAFVCDLTPDCSDGSDESAQVCNAPIQYRLEGGRSKNEGRLEVLYRGEWGTVCDDDFGIKEAQVVCNALGFYGKPEVAKNIYGPGRGPIWLDQVSCIGNETCLDKCTHFTWGENNCQHTEDVGLKCTAGPKLSQPSAPLYPNVDRDIAQHDLEYEQTELDDLGKYQGLWQRSSKAVHHQKQCGHFKSNLFDEYAHPEERVINGSIAKRGRHPWQATIRTRGRGGISSHWCGAVIISKKLVLTAAHCLAGYPKGSYFVRMGDHYANIAESSEVDSNIENWYIHEKFRDLKHMNNDIALILLKTPVKFNDYIQPICLPEKGAKLEANRKCTISGWGSIKSGTSTPSNILRAAEVPILADDICTRRDVYANAMSEGMFCAGFLDENADACDGDSGGPLVCPDADGETLYGIISWGQHCGYRNHPGVYVRVEKYIDWIYEKINLMIQQGKL